MWCSVACEDLLSLSQVAALLSCLLHTNSAFVPQRTFSVSVVHWTRIRVDQNMQVWKAYVRREARERELPWLRSNGMTNKQIGSGANRGFHSGTGDKVAGAWDWSKSRAEVKSELTYTYNPLYEFMAYTGIILPYLLVAHVATFFNSDSGKAWKISAYPIPASIESHCVLNVTQTHVSLLSLSAEFT